MARLMKFGLADGAAELFQYCSHTRTPTKFVLATITTWTPWKLYFRRVFEVDGFLPVPQARTMPYSLSSGLTVRVPIETNQCWDAAIPCSPSFADSLQLRRGENLRWGFRVEGLDSSLSSDKFTPLHRRYVRSNPVEERCMNCHLQTN